MVKKPTYEELEQRVEELEKEAVERKLLEESVNLLSTVVKTSVDAISVASPVDGKLIYCNESFLKWWKVKDDYTNLTYHECFDVDVNVLEKAVQATMIGSWSGELTAKAMDGQTFPVLVTSSPVKDKDGKTVGLLGIFKAFAERKQAEEALQEERNKLEAIVDAIEYGLTIQDRDYNIIYQSEVLRNIFGGLGQKCYRVYEGKDKSCDGCPVQMAWADGKSHTSERKVVMPSGEIAFWENTANPIRDANGEFVACLEIARNITERKRAEKALKESQERYRTQFEEALDAIFIGDAETGIVIDCNRAALELVGKAKSEVVGKHQRSLHPPEEVEGGFSRAFKQHLKEKQRQALEARVIAKNGEIRDVSIKANIFKLKGRKVVQQIFRDVTERKYLETQLQQAQKMEAIGTLAGGVAHDFNNVLMGIQGHTSLMLLRIDSDHPDFRHLKGIEDSIDSGASLTKQLLGFGSGGKYDVKPTDLNELIEKSSELFDRTQKGVRHHRKYQKEIWPVEVDRGQIEQVLLNLYVNAWQAMPHGGDLYVETGNVVLDENHTRPFDKEPGNYVKVSLTDTGVGMDKATQQRIFDPFFTTDVMGRGTGLGLASAYGIIKNHSGMIIVDSKKGKGTTFNLYLPASEKKVTIKIEEEELAEEILKGTETVLLVDDEEKIIDVGGEMLKELGYKVLLARSGKEAVEVYTKHKDEIDLVILDIIMPDMGGGEAYDRMKKDDRKVKVLLSSGYSMDGQATEILERGGDAFIQKPFNMKELSVKIREILDKK
jgi:PAS domain S-box-containing protein